MSSLLCGLLWHVELQSNLPVHKIRKVNTVWRGCSMGNVFHYIIIDLMEPLTNEDNILQAFIYSLPSLQVIHTKYAISPLCVVIWRVQIREQGDDQSIFLLFWLQQICSNISRVALYERYGVSSYRALVSLFKSNSTTRPFRLEIHW